jgi:hypothetical protein
VPLIVDAAVAAVCGERSNGAARNAALERNLRRGLADAAGQWFASSPSRASRDLHFRLGRAQVRAGRSLEELMAFYRVAGQAAWRRLSELGPEQGVEPEQLYLLAESGLGLVDELSFCAAAGFTEERGQRTGTAQSRRSELLRELLRDPQPAQEVLRADARAAGVELTPTVAVFVGDAEHWEGFAQAARAYLVLGPSQGEFVGALFDPDGPQARDRLAAVAGGCDAQVALGPVVDCLRIRSSHTQARALLRLIQQGHVASRPLVRADQEQTMLLLASDPDLAGEIVRRRLAPLDSVDGQSRVNLTRTLQAWLRAQGHRKAIAYDLGVHPQTVRYRMARLRDLFGAVLDHPDQRFELELALRLEPLANQDAKFRNATKPGRLE